MNKLLKEFLSYILLKEYTEKEKAAMGIPSGAKARGKFWYSGDVYIGTVVNGKFVAAKPGETPGKGKDAGERLPTEPSTTPSQPASQKLPDDPTQVDQVVGAELDKIADSPEGDALFPNESKQRRKALLAGMARTRAVASGEVKGTTPEQQKNADEFSRDQAELLRLRAERDRETDPSRKKELQRQMTDLAGKMLEKYKLYTDTRGRQFKGADAVFGRNGRKICGENDTALPKLMVEVFTECGLGEQLKAGGDKRAQRRVDLARLSKVRLGEPRTGPSVSKIFDRLGLPVRESDRAVYGPVDDNGELLPNANGENARAYTRHSVESQRSVTDEVSTRLEADGYPEMAAAVRAHQERMEALMEDDSLWGPPDTDELRQQRERIVDESFAQMTIDMSDPSTGGDPESAAAALKNLSETFLYQKEIAAGAQAYLPASGNFPVADKLVVRRDGNTGMERVQRVSIKFGESSGGSVGMPAQSRGYMELDSSDDGFYSGTCRDKPEPCTGPLTSGKPGEEDYSIGIRDDVATDPKQVSRLLDDSGAAEAGVDAGEVAKANAAMVECVKQNRSTPPGAAVKTCQEQHGDAIRSAVFGPDMQCTDKPRGGKVCKCTTEECKAREKKLRETMGDDAVDTMLRHPAMSSGVMATVGVIRKNEGFPNVDHCSMAVKKGKKATKKKEGVKPQFKQKCVTGSTKDPNCWRIDARYADERAGGVRVSYSCPEPEKK